MGRFKSGLFVGGLLGASFVWMMATKKGRKTLDEILEHASVVYSRVKSEVLDSDAWKKMTQNEYFLLVNNVVDKYAVQTGLADEVKRLVSKLVKIQWKQLVNKTRK